MPPQKYRGVLCKSPMENHKPMAESSSGKSRSQMSHCDPLLGFKSMVAPTSETAGQGDPGTFHPTISRDVQELLGRIHAGATLAPNLHGVVRKGLESKQIPSEMVDTYLKRVNSLERYERSFKLFWSFCQIKGMDATQTTLTQVAGLLVQFDQILPNQARHAYASLLLIPGMEQLQFNPLLRQVKKTWNTSNSRYTSFFDASTPIAKLAAQPLDWECPTQIRTRLILAFRFFMLCRSIDLERMYRTISMLNGQPYVLVRRKGWLRAKWEAVVTLPGQKNLCPWSLLQKYVALTSKNATPGTNVFRSSVHPFLPLKANSIGSLTKRALAELGVDTSIWKPHSTRGAGVNMYKNLGMSSEQVCELGKWKNVAAFSSHYLRLGATNVASQKISELVHNVSPLGVAEPDLTWTPGMKDTGGSVREGEARSNGEPTLPPDFFLTETPPLKGMGVKMWRFLLIHPLGGLV